LSEDKNALYNYIINFDSTDIRWEEKVKEEFYGLDIKELKEECVALIDAFFVSFNINIDIPTQFEKFTDEIRNDISIQAIRYWREQWVEYKKQLAEFEEESKLMHELESEEDDYEEEDVELVYIISNNQIHICEKELLIPIPGQPNYRGFQINKGRIYGICNLDDIFDSFAEAANIYIEHY
jgi:hypothetical protein